MVMDKEVRRRPLLLLFASGISMNFREKVFRGTWSFLQSLKDSVLSETGTLEVEENRTMESKSSVLNLKCNGERVNDRGLVYST